jgi:hypothetical protein
MTAYETFLSEHDLRDMGVEPAWTEKLRDRSVGRAVKL